MMNPAWSSALTLALMLAISSVLGCGPDTVESNSHPAAAQSSSGANAAADTSARELQETEATMSNTQIVIASDQGEVTAELIDNAATRALLRMLPLTIEMRDHLRQEKTGTLPSPLPEEQRQTNFSVGTLGIWGNDDFVIYTRNGRVPAPGIIVIGRVIGDVAIFDHPGPVTVRIALAE